MGINTFEFKSIYLGCPTTVKILTPDYSSQRPTPNELYGPSKFKVLWLLHGAANGPNDWLLFTNIAKYVQHKDLIAVLPFALNSDYSNYTVFANGFNFWDFFLKELQPMVYHWFPASQKREDNFIAGYSMGGTGAMMFGFAHPELFGGIGILSSAIRDIDCLRPYRNMTGEQFRKEGFDTSRFTGTYPPGFNQKEINMIAKYPTVGDFLDSPENTWDRYIEAQQKGILPPIYVSVGSKDRCLSRVKKFQHVANQLHAQNITFEIIEGYDHEISCWDIGINKTLQFFKL